MPDYDPYLLAGSEGTKDYMPVAFVDCLCLSVKPLVEVIEADTKFRKGLTILKMLVGMRIRASKRSKDVIVNVGDKIDLLVPMFKWTKKDKNRASLVVADDALTSYSWKSREDWLRGIATHDTGRVMWNNLIINMQDKYEPFPDLELIDLFFHDFIEQKVDTILSRAEKAGISVIPETYSDNVVYLKPTD